MTNQPLSHVMELRKLWQDSGFDLLCRKTSLRHIRRTLTAEGIDSTLVHLEMKEQPIGSLAVPKGLERSNV